MPHAKRWLYLVHRWLGVLLCAFFAMWFVSGVVMMYVGYPKLTQAERLAHLPPLRSAMLARIFHACSQRPAQRGIAARM